MSYTEKVFDFLPPGGQFQNLVGGVLGDSVITVTKMIHHINSTQAIYTITTPYEGFAGPVFLVADSAFTWGGTGNIATTSMAAASMIANHAYGFIYDRVQGKWYPLAETK